MKNFKKSLAFPETKCYNIKCRKANREIGVDHVEGTPVPIPNTEVKLDGAEDTWVVTPRENREMPMLYSSRPIGRLLFYYLDRGVIVDITDKNIDGGKTFDWGRVSGEYAKYRDIYPKEFYDKILDLGLCKDGQSVLDVGTGTGVLPRNMYRYGAKWTGTDISENQIEQAKLLSKGMDIDYFTVPTEKISFTDNTFDVITACQCFWYFKHEITSKLFYNMLKENGSLLVLYMAWLPFEDKIAGESEKLVLKYSPGWSGQGERVHPIGIPDCYKEYFDPVCSEEYRLNVHFTRESWNGRMKACRGVGASLSTEEIARWEREHLELLNRIAPSEFDVMHYAAMVWLKVKKQED